MRLTTYPALPEDLRSLAAAIESSYGCPILLSPRLGEPSPLSLEPDSMAVEVLPDRATVFYWPEYDPTPNGILHELLHVRRFWVEKVPKIILGEGILELTGHLEDALARLDNGLEHLTIVPLESELGYGRPDRWLRMLTKYWDLSPGWSQDYKPFFRQNALVGHTSVLHMFPNSELAQSLPQRLEAIGLGASDIEGFDSVRSLTGNKEAQVEAAMRVIGYDKKDWQLYSYDG